MAGADPDLLEEWEIWRPVLAKAATWRDLDQYWSLEELDKVNAVLDIRDAIQEALMPEPPGGSK